MRRLAAGLAVCACLGPRTGAQEPTPLPTANPIITSLAVFAGTQSGLWQSRNWGGTWEKRQGEELESTGAIHAILALGPRVFAGGDGGLWVSDDFGAKWTRAWSERAVFAILTSRYPLADATVLLGTPDGLYRSPDWGRTVGPLALPGVAVTRLEWPGPALVAATAQGLLVSKDSGRTFKGPEKGLPPGAVRAMALSSYFAVDPVLFAAPDSGGVHHSADGGATWQPAGLEGRLVSDLYWLGPFLYAATDAGVWRTQDLGRNWVALGKGIQAATTRLLFPLAPDSGATIFVASEAGVYRTLSGGFLWQPSGLAEEKVLTVATFPPPQQFVGPKKKK
jgi:photosystem II stability/assembly factor-like uncharacterized protein